MVAAKSALLLAVNAQKREVITDRPTDRPTDIVTYRVACTRLKTVKCCLARAMITIKQLFAKSFQTDRRKNQRSDLKSRVPATKSLCSISITPAYIWSVI